MGISENAAFDMGINALCRFYGKTSGKNNSKKRTYLVAMRIGNIERV